MSKALALKAEIVEIIEFASKNSRTHLVADLRNILATIEKEERQHAERLKVSPGSEIDPIRARLTQRNWETNAQPGQPPLAAHH